MKTSIKVFLWTLLLVLVAAIFFAARWGYQRIATVDDKSAREHIGATLKLAIAQLDAAPSVPPLKPVADKSEPEQAAEYIEKKTRLRHGDISDLRHDLPLAIKRFEAGEGSEKEILRVLSAAHESHTKALPALDAWVKDEPNNYAALVARGIVRSAIGWHQRGGDYIVYTAKENLLEMKRWHQLALDDFALSLSKSRYPVLAIAELLGISMANGWQEESKKLYLAGERLYPASDDLFSGYYQSLYTEWGTGSLQAAKAFLKHAERNGVSMEARSFSTRKLANIETHDRYVSGEPDALPYAIEFSERYDTVDGWSFRASVEEDLEQYDDALESLKRVIEKSPASYYVMQDMVTLLRKMKRDDDATLAMRRAADLGSNWAQDEIIGDMIWERNGVKRDWAKIQKECELSAEMQMAAGQACMGQLYTERTSGYPKDPVKAAYWYALAARQGDPQGQHDYGYVLLNGIGVEKDHEKGMFYMRNSARQKFPYALDKLKDMGERTDNLEWKIGPMEDAKRMLNRMLDKGAAWKEHF